jgi:hypothetical protein
MKALSIFMFSALACVASEVLELRRFEPPLTVDDASMAAIQSDHPWVRACCSEWMPWAFTFEEWSSYRSQNHIESQKMDSAKFGGHQREVASRAPRWSSVLATLPLSHDGEDFLIVVSYHEKLNHYPKEPSDLKFGFRKMLLRNSASGWRLVDLGTDIPYDSPVAKKLISINFAALGIPEKKPEPNQSLQPTAPSGRG